jgi:hypothetical protein
VLGVKDAEVAVPPLSAWLSGPKARSVALHTAVLLGPYRLNVTVPVGTPDPVPGATVTVSVTDVPCTPPALATVVVVVGPGVVVGAVMVTDSFAAPHPLEDAANPEPDAGV